MDNIFGKNVNNSVQNARNVAATMGKAALHALAPDNVEYYLCSLELLNSVGTSKAFMTFVVMPNNIMETTTPISTITKTAGGLVTVFNDGFNPVDISIQGTFGRRVRVLIGMKELSESNTLPFFDGISAGDVNVGVDLFGDKVLVKSGYGLAKMLQKIIDASQTIDPETKQPYIIVYHNYAWNSQYIVEIQQKSYSMGVDNNMLWFYSLEMKGVAPATAIIRKNKDSTTFMNTVRNGAIAREITKLIMEVVNITRQQPIKL